MSRSFLVSRWILAALTASTASVAWAGGFASPTSVAGLSEAGAIVADSQPLSAYAINPAGMVYFPGTRAGLDLIAQRPSATFSGPSGSVGASTNTSILGDLFVTHRFNSLPLAVGLGITSPYTLRSDWAAGALNGSNPELQNQLRVIDINPALAYLLTPNLSVAAGVDYYQTLGGKFGQTSGNGGGVGGNIGLLYSTEAWNAGLTYRSPASIGVAGAHLDLPSKVQAGFRYRWTRAFATELDVDWTDWSNAQLPYYGSLGWKSALAYRVGLSYRLNQDLEIRGGLAHEDSPAGAEAVQLASPATSSNLAAFGLGMGLGAWQYDLGASYAFSGSASGAAFNLPGTGGTVPPASYKTSDFLFGLSLSRHF